MTPGWLKSIQSGKLQVVVHSLWVSNTGTAKNAEHQELRSKSWGVMAALGTLVAPYCAIPRDYLSDTPLLRRYGVFGVSTWPIGCDTPSPFSERFPLGERAKWRCDTPPQKGYLSDTCAIPFENKANGCDTPLCDTISKGYCAIWGGISHRAAKLGTFKGLFVSMFSKTLGGIRKTHVRERPRG